MPELCPTEITFAERLSIEQVEEGNELAPKFDQNGCLPCITLHAETREVLMFAFVNEEALRLTISSGLAHYWSRSRQKLWKKGETSGMFQQVKRMLIDDDQDCLILEVTLTPPTIGGKEASCHVGYRSCFYRELSSNPEPGKPVELRFTENQKSFDASSVYEGTTNPTQL
ncbi:MAG: phosphoribosyl-AMP cyclohydrolase [Verrucomicrobiota bacterium JB023]|nr:phosphoribosyl-AMP cyclohydrolase [Verrucomicrobiota bacterium JB023]